MKADRDSASAESPETIPRPRGLLIHSVVVAFGALLVAWVWSSRIERFRELFRSFGADLPAATRFILNSAWIWYVLALCAAALSAWVTNKPAVNRMELRRMKLAVRGLTVVIALLVAFAFYAIYAGILKLSAVV